MPARTSKVLTEAEQELMEVVWELGRGTAEAIREALSSLREASNSTVRTILRILERKGYVRHCEQNGVFVYEPVIDREEATRRMIRHLADRVSEGSTSLLVQHILKVEPLSGEELKRIKEWVEEEVEAQEGEG